MASLVDLLKHLADGETLSVDQTRAAIHWMMDGTCAETEIAAFLTALRVRGETVEELVGAATALREKCLTPPGTSRISGLLDTCGTGGDHAGTFNISTATALVVAACGVPVAKHGNRSVSSTSGSADVLQRVGLNLDASPEIVSGCLREIGLGFFFAPHWHPAMKNVMPVRRALKFRTIFNLLGPLANPAGAEFQLLGVSRADWAEKIAEAILRLGTRSATVVSGSDGLDEVTLAGPTLAVRVVESQITVETWLPNKFGLPTWSAETLRVSSPQESAAVLTAVLGGKHGPHRDIVLANAAAALLTVGKVATLRAGVAMAADAIDREKAQQKLSDLVRYTCNGA